MEEVVRHFAAITENGGLARRMERPLARPLRLTVGRSMIGRMGAAPPRLFTVGYEGRSASSLIDELTGRGVEVIVDMRLTPASRQAGLSKRGLAGAAQAAGISYLHLPELGNPRDIRHALRAGNTAARSRYRMRLRSPPGAGAVRRIGPHIEVEHVR